MKAAEYAQQLAATYARRPTFPKPNGSGAAVIAHVDLASRPDDGALVPVIVLQSCALDYQRFKELVDWARAQFEEE